MEKFTKLTGAACPIEQANVNTDQIIPARFLKWTRDMGIGKVLFNDLRRDAEGRETPDFPLNRPAWRDAKIVVAALLGTYLLGLPHNFGATQHFDTLVVFALWILAGYAAESGSTTTADQQTRATVRASASCQGTDNNDTRGLEVGTDPTGRTFASLGGQLLVQTLPTWEALTPPGPAGNDCRNIAWENGSVYVCLFGDGVSRLRDGVWRNYNGGACRLPACSEDTTFRDPSFSFSLLVDPLGTKWIGMWNSVLTRFDDGPAPPQSTTPSWPAYPDAKARRTSATPDHHSCR